MYKLDMNATFKILKIMEKSKIKNEEIFNHIPGITMIMSRDGSILKGNSFLANLLNAEVDDIVTKSVTDLFSKEGGAKLLAHIDDVEVGKDVNFDAKLDGLDDGGEELSNIFNWNISFLTHFADRKVDAYLVVARDITQIRVYQEEILEHNRNLEEKVRERTADLQEALTDLKQLQEKLVSNAQKASMGEMAGNMAHEINNPLTIVRYGAKTIEKILERKNVSDAKITKNLGKIDMMVDRMAAIIANLKDFSREADSDPMDDVSFATLFDELMTLTQEKFVEANITLTYDLEQFAKLTFYCNRVTISQVLSNLLSNAFDFVLNLETDRWVKVEAKEDEHYFECRVTDSGAGIDAEIVPKIFKPFFTTRDLGKGVGLGLSMSAGVIEEQHRGKIFVDTDHPNTSIIFRIPKNLREILDSGTPRVPAAKSDEEQSVNDKLKELEDESSKKGDDEGAA